MPIPVFAPAPGSGEPPYTPPPKTPRDPATYTPLKGTWHAASGDSFEMWDCSTGVSWLGGREGTDMPPWELTTQENIDDDGQTIVAVRAKARTVTLPLLIHLDTFGAWRKLHQRVMRAFDPSLGDGVLEIMQPDGVARQLRCRYTAGLEGADIADPRGLWHRIYAMQLTAADPWWYAPAPVVVPFNTGSSAGFLDPPFLPLKLGASSALGAVDIDNVGDVPAYPVWTLTGPAGVTNFTNRTTGRVLSFDPGLADGETAEVDMRPRRQHIIKNDGTNPFPTRIGTPDFWPIVRGVNDITLDVAGASTATSVSITYTPRYLTA